MVRYVARDRVGLVSSRHLRSFSLLFPPETSNCGWGSLMRTKVYLLVVLPRWKRGSFWSSAEGTTSWPSTSVTTTGQSRYACACRCVCVCVQVCVRVCVSVRACVWVYVKKSPNGGQCPLQPPALTAVVCCAQFRCIQLRQMSLLRSKVGHIIVSNYA